MIAVIGAFDGFHRGHQLLFERAAAFGSDWGVITFACHPDSYFKSCFRALFTDSEQQMLERYCGVPSVLRIDFTPEVANMQPHDFLDYISLDFGVDGVVVGADFHFGVNRTGTTEFLEDECRRRGWNFAVVPVECAAGCVPISSTDIRNAVASGDLRYAWEMLGYPFFCSGRVVHGDKRGRDLGFPTANIEILPQKIELQRGVYSTLVYLDGAWRVGAVNVGVIPTFGEKSRARFEAHMLDYTGDLYGRELTFFMLEHVRSEMVFKTAEDLKSRIAEDAGYIKVSAASALQRDEKMWERFASLF